eukprot:3267395-Rhodomonas_salina.1
MASTQRQQTQRGQTRVISKANFHANPRQSRPDLLHKRRVLHERLATRLRLDVPNPHGPILRP